MKKIWKFAFHPAGLQNINMPANTRILSVGVRNDIITLWGLVDPEEKTVNRQFAVRGTGHPVDEVVENAVFIGTVFVGIFVWHIFDCGEF